MFEKLENFIFEKMCETRLPSLSIAAIKGNEIIYSKAFGFKDVAQGLAATPATLYGIGSVTKSFTALAIMQLFEQGKLSLDDPIDKYMSFPIKPKGETIRITHFLSHTSGIPALAHAEATIRAKTRRGYVCLTPSEEYCYNYSEKSRFLLHFSIVRILPKLSILI